MTAAYTEMRSDIRDLRDRLARNADATRPSRKTQIEDEAAAALSAILESYPDDDDER